MAIVLKTVFVLLIGVLTAYATNGDIGKIAAICPTMVLCIHLWSDAVNDVRKLRSKGEVKWI